MIRVLMAFNSSHILPLPLPLPLLLLLLQSMSQQKCFEPGNSKGILEFLFGFTYIFSLNIICHLVPENSIFCWPELVKCLTYSKTRPLPLYSPRILCAISQLKGLHVGGPTVPGSYKSVLNYFKIVWKRPA